MRLFLTLVVGATLAGCGQNSDGWRDLAWGAHPDQASNKLSDIEFQWRKVDSVPPPDLSSISSPARRMLVEHTHYAQHPKVEDQTIPPEQIKGVFRHGSCSYQVSLEFNDNGGVNQASEQSSLYCSDAAKKELSKKYGEPTFVEKIPLRDCGMSYARGVMETVAWAKEGTRAVYERRCGADRFTVTYSPLRY
ncbi:hypothetical protein AB6N01_20475 [Alcaligenes nematophilus]|uniref:hypothetical protein n=1 Tax=Alcaligenes nematophilus TaxID=2994643 RepID=UPI0034E05C43